MRDSLKFITFLLCFGLTIGCGVKGVPLPPLTPAPIGRGEPNFSKATETVQLKKVNLKIEGDFDDEDDFSETEEKK